MGILGEEEFRCQHYLIAIRIHNNDEDELNGSQQFLNLYIHVVAHRSTRYV
jgi:hypothetical protein